MKKALLQLLAVFVGSLSASAQGAHNIKINEVMTSNTASIQDEYGAHNPWVELTNISYSSYNVRGMYVTTDRRTLDRKLSVPQRVKMMSAIPSGDDRTLMSARQYLLLHLNSTPEQGTLHLSTPVDAAQPLWIAVFDGNGVDLIDSVTVPRLAPNQSYARTRDGSATWETRYQKDVTPYIGNLITPNESKVAKIKREDPHGIGITILSMGIVFFCLALLYAFFRLLGIFMAHKIAIKKAKNIQPIKVAVKTGEKIAETGHKTNVILKGGLHTKGIDREIYMAVIAMALKQYQDDVHDNESNIITIKPHHTLWNAHMEH